jgi:hypothetical protein
VRESLLKSELIKIAQDGRGRGSAARDGYGRQAGMDQAYVQGLRNAKALLDEGIFSEQEFMREKETLLMQRSKERATHQGAFNANKWAAGVAFRA